MVIVVLYDEIRAIVREFEASGARDFRLEDVAGRLKHNASSSEILKTLTELWEAEGTIYSEVVGGAIWVIGRVSPAVMGRKPFARRS